MAPQRRKYLSVIDDEENKPAKRAKNMNSTGSYKRSKYSQDVPESNGFNHRLCSNLFHQYTSIDDSDVIGPEGIERFCLDIDVEPENIVMLVLAWKMDVKQMGFITKKEWTKGMAELQCDSINKLKDKIDYLRCLLNEPSIFKSIYRYAFDFARDRDQRNIDMETSKAMLQLLLGKHWPLYPYFRQFLDQSKYKVMNKDQWCNVLEFSRSILADLQNYDEDGAWPVLLDEFVDWLRKKQQIGVITN